MNEEFLTKSGEKISKVCYGTLTLGPLQRNCEASLGASLLKKAYDLGINFFDTAEIYGTYKHINGFLKMDIKREDVIIATKSYSYDFKTAKDSLDKALMEMGTDYIDFFLLHEQESEHTIRGHAEAIEYFLEQKKKGIIRWFGVSTHFIECVNIVKDLEYIDVIHSILNVDGIGIQDGTVNDMVNQLTDAKLKGKFIYAMKPLGGGHLIKNYEYAINFIMNQDYVDAVAIGMQSEDEIIANIISFQGEEIPLELKEKISNTKRTLIIANWCTGCGICVERCQHGALKIAKNKAEVNLDVCVLCGYCSKSCPNMCIKVI